MESLFERVRDYLTNHNIGAFGQIAGVDQFFRQAECDVVGIACSAHDIEYHVAEVAYHAAGLDGDYASKVASKMIRAAFVLFNYFNQRRGHIYFVTPKTRPGVLNPLNEVISCIRQFFATEGFGYEFTLVTNEAFRNTILVPVFDVAADVADTGELFLRAYQLATCFDDVMLGHAQRRHEGGRRFGMGVGRLAQTEIPPVLRRMDMASQEFLGLLDGETCHQIFRLNYPLLTTERDAIDPDRYYAEPIDLFGRNYWLCNDWYERNRGPLEDWIDQH